MIASALALALTMGIAAPAPAVPEAGQVPPILQNVEIVEQLGRQVPLQATFRDQTGRAVALSELLRYEQVMIYDSQAAASYYSFAETERHFGLGQRTAVDVSVEFYAPGKTVWQRGAAANGTIVIRE